MTERDHGNHQELQWDGTQKVTVGRMVTNAKLDTRVQLARPEEKGTRSGQPEQTSWEVLKPTRIGRSDKWRGVDLWRIK